MKIDTFDDSKAKIFGTNTKEKKRDKMSCYWRRVTDMAFFTKSVIKIRR